MCVQITCTRIHAPTPTNTCGWRAIRAGKCAAGLAGAHYEAWPNPQTLSHSTTQTL